MRQIGLSLATVACVMLLITPHAQAYLDPGAGSILLQALIGGVAAALVLTKLYWTRLKGFFGGASRKPKTAERAPAYKPEPEKDE